VTDGRSDEPDDLDEDSTGEPILFARVEPLPGGGARFAKGPIERLLLSDLLDDLESRLSTADPSTRRLFPPAYPDDPEAEAEYQSMLHAELVDGRQARIGAVRDTLERDALTAEEVEAWVGVLNDLRLTLGSELEVAQDEDVPEEGDPRREPFVRYVYLGWLQEQFVEAAAASLGDEVA